MKTKRLLNLAGGLFVFGISIGTAGAQYCTPNPASNCGLDDEIINVTFAGINNTTGCTSGYGDYTSGTAATVNGGGTYSISVTVGEGGNEAIAAWIDYDHSNTFDASEYIYIGNVPDGTATATVNIPATAMAGATRMRVRSFYVTSSGNPATIYTTTPDPSCAAISTNFGETEDYTVNITAATDCAGVPASVTVTASAASVCTSTNLMLTTSNTPENGLTYQWQSSPDGTTWTNLGAAQTASSYNATGQTSAMQYRVIVTCTNGGATVTSNAVSVGQNALSACLCTPVLDCTDNDMITNVTFETINNNSTCGTDGYSSYTSMTPAEIETGQDYPISVTVGDGWASESVSVWIDYNHNGTFEASEFTFIATGSDEALSGTISVPATAMAGNTTMRVRVAAVGDADATDDMACDEEQGYGETEDYTVNITVSSVPVIDSVVVTTQGNVPAIIATPTGTLQMEASVYPLTSNQDVTWSIIPITGTATISATGLVTATSAGTVWAKAVSDEDAMKKDSIVVTINPLPQVIDSVVVTTQGNVPATIATPTGTLQVQATVYPLTSSQDVSWDIVNVTGTATISMTGLVTASSAGTVWARAISDTDISKKDSILITIQPLVINVDSVDVKTQGNVAAAINTQGGTLQLVATIYPSSLSQNVTWSIIPGGSGSATISATGLVTAQANGNVWAKAVSVQTPSKADSIQIQITNQDLGISDLFGDASLSAFPNPTSDAVKLQSDSKHESMSLRVTDATGNVLYRSALKANELNQGVIIDLGSYAPGIYFVTLENPKGSATRSIVRK